MTGNGAGQKPRSLSMVQGFDILLHLRTSDIDILDFFRWTPKKISSTSKTCMRTLSLWRSCIIPEWHCTNGCWDPPKAMINLIYSSIVS